MKPGVYCANHFADREAWPEYTITIPSSEQTRYGNAMRYSTLDLKLRAVIFKQCNPECHRAKNYPVGRSKSAGRNL